MSGPLQFELDNYQAWLHHAANRCGDPNLHDDLFQEGLIAMWQQAEKHGGEHAGFMTSQARLRINDVARGAKAFGGIKVAVREVKPVANVEQFDIEISPEQADIADAAMWAYHHGEIYAAIERLAPKQREATHIFLRDGILTDTQRVAFGDARKKLAIELDHLRNLVSTERVQSET